MKKIIFLLIALAFINKGNGQTNLPCPPIILERPKDGKITEGEDAIFTLKPFDKAYDDYLLTYNWSKSNGIMTRGQGTSTVHIETNGLKGQTITTTVEIGGIGPGCPYTKSITINVIAKKFKTKTKQEPKN